jgi:hypothetical protein
MQQENIIILIIKPKSVSLIRQVSVMDSGIVYNILPFPSNLIKVY